MRSSRGRSGVWIHVVKTFLNFNKPIELEARPIDLSQTGGAGVRFVIAPGGSQERPVETALRRGYSSTEIPICCNRRF